MKRGKGDGKVMGPMFPRLHVNDTEKGGPRAPPRNKMALYEQLSIPSQRFNPRISPPNSNGKNNSLSMASSSQDTCPERNLLLPCHLPPASPSHLAKMCVSRQSSGPNLHTSLAPLEQGKKVDEDDFRVPVYAQSRTGQCNNKTQKSNDAEKLTPLGSTCDSLTTEDQNICDRDQEINDSPRLNTKADPRIECEGHTRDCFHSVDNRTSLPKIHNGLREYDNTNGASMQTGELDRIDVIFKTSMVDTVLGMDISPDDVVEVIGQKHFWKARRAIVNQQRVFALQVFELHRLIKVQQLIAGSPDLLLEDGDFVGKSSLKEPPTKKLSLEYVVKSRPESLKRKDNPEKLNDKMERSAENAVGKTSISSVKNGSHLSNYAPVSGNPHQAADVTDNKMGHWCYHQSPGHQWLIPVVSPSEGLVYKPYSGPGFTGTVCGGCGPFGPSSISSNIMNPVYGVPGSHQGLGILPCASPMSYAYFPPFGVHAMNSTASSSDVEQMNQFVQPGSHGHSGQLSGGEVNFHMNKQSSLNLPQGSGAAPQVLKFQTPRESELQGSTASSPVEMEKGVQTGQNAEGKDAAPFFPMAPAIPEGVLQTRETEQPIQVIKVIPRHSRSATESAARIFQSIQAERKQLDSA